MALNILASLRNGSDSMFESLLFETLCCVLGNYDYADFWYGPFFCGEWQVQVQPMMRRKLALICLMMVKAIRGLTLRRNQRKIPMEKPQNVTPEGAAPKANSLVNRAQARGGTY